MEVIINLQHHETVKIVLSAPKKEAPKTVIKPIMLKKNKTWQCEKIIENSAFHENIPESGLSAYMEKILTENQYRQINIITADFVFAYRFSKKNKLYMTKTPNKKNLKQPLKHNNEKNYILAEGMPVLPLVDLGVFTQDFHIIKSKHSKYKQINNFLNNIVSCLRDDINSALNIIEFGCGKSYLTFILYYYFRHIKNIDVKITGYDKDRYAVEFCNNVARKYGYENLEFIEGDISQITSYNGNVDMMVSLHACDTATDHALYYAIKNKVKYIFCVPCCQHEVNARISCDDEYSLLLRYGLYKERFSALLTDSIRCDVLSDNGYHVDAVEFTGEENTPKNAMIRAYYTGHKKNYLESTLKLISRFGIEHTLIKLLYVDFYKNEK